jgi:DNA mismatch repair protein MutL
MPRIHILPDILASQVAAGEVVERPASAVKELVENSLDAGAREVFIEIRRGGAALLKVTDDGCGMSQEDALLSLERHATSKLRVAKDLAEIMTLGFRGEAVPSMASVSRFRLCTREPEAISGTEIQVEGGVVRDVREAGCAPGTTVEVKDLFFNVPARRKFLKAESTEAAHIEHQIRLHALAAAGVRFRFRKDDREVFDLPGGMSRHERVRWMLGTELGREVISMSPTQGNGIEVEGFVLPALHARKGRRHQCVFLNGRPVEDAAISRGLLEGFRGAMSDGFHPAAWLWIELEPHLVDVNVHPAKKEIRLHRPHELREAIETAVREGLRNHERARLATPSRIEEAARNAAAAISPSPRLVPSPRPAAPTAPREWPKEIIVQRDLRLEPSASEPAAPAAAHAPQQPVEPAVQVPDFRYIGTLLDRYALLESEDGLVMLDPRAARERILYERFLKTTDESALEAQSLLIPLLLEPGPREVELAMRYHDDFSRAGIEFEDFGGGTLRVGTLPAMLDLPDPRAFVLALLDAVADGQQVNARVSFEVLAKILARRAALAERAKPEEALKILRPLFACELPYCAPDGRPTLTEFSIRELDRRFGNPGGK